jgi:hypothetical protein
MGRGACADAGAMTSTAHDPDVLVPSRLRRALANPRLRTRSTLAQGLAPLAALGVLVLLLKGHDLTWLAGVVAGASTTAWLVGLRAPSAAVAVAPVDHGDGAVREQLSLLEPAGWSSVHDLDARYGRYRHVAIGPGGVILLQSQRLEHPWRSDDPDCERELVLQRRRALSAAANLRRELEDVIAEPRWVQPVVVVWSEFSVGCLQDGRCVFVSGPRLVDWLRRRPGQLAPQRAKEIFAALDALADPLVAEVSVVPAVAA